jgi:hypothetical protein
MTDWKSALAKITKVRKGTASESEANTLHPQEASLREHTSNVPKANRMEVLEKLVSRLNAEKRQSFRLRDIQKIIDLENSISKTREDIDRVVTRLRVFYPRLSVRELLDREEELETVISRKIEAETELSKSSELSKRFEVSSGSLPAEITDEVDKPKETNDQLAKQKIRRFKLKCCSGCGGNRLVGLKACEVCGGLRHIAGQYEEISESSLCPFGGCPSCGGIGVHFFNKQLAPRKCRSCNGTGAGQTNCVVCKGYGFVRADKRVLPRSIIDSDTLCAEILKQLK